MDNLDIWNLTDEQLDYLQLRLDIRASAREEEAEQLLKLQEEQRIAEKEEYSRHYKENFYNRRGMKIGKDGESYPMTTDEKVDYKLARRKKWIK